jgi:hypothetical protein
VETILYRLVASGNGKGIKVRRGTASSRRCSLWREDTEAFCRERGVEPRLDSTNATTTRGLIRGEILPLLERIHPASRENILRSLETRRTMPPALAELLDTPGGSRRVDLGGGLQAVREHDRLWLERGPVRLDGEVSFGGWRDSLRAPGPYRSRVEARRPPRRALEEDQTCSSTPRSRAPTVKAGRSWSAASEVVAVPGIIEAEGIEVVRG